MGKVMNTLRRFFRRAAREEDGTATIPFVIFVPFFLLLVMSSLEMGTLMTRHVLLERALDLSVRDLRLGTWTPTDPNNAGNELRARICNYFGLLSNCPQTLMIELRPVSKVTWAPLSSGANCVDRSKPVNVNPLPTFGTSNEMMLIRACMKVNPIFPTSGLGFALSKDGTGAYTLVSSSAFVNEPRPGS